MIRSDHFQSLTNFILHLSFLISISAFETTILSPIKVVPHTDLWIMPVVYFALHREVNSGAFFCLLASLVVGAFTATPYSTLLLSLLITFTAIHFIKSRFFIEGVPYFMMISLGSIFSFYISFFLSSWLFYETPTSSPEVFSWILSALVSPLFAGPIRFVFWFIDTLTNTKQPFGFEVN